MLSKHCSDLCSQVSEADSYARRKAPANRSQALPLFVWAAVRGLQPSHDQVDAEKQLLQVGDKASQALVELFISIWRLSAGP